MSLGRHSESEDSDEELFNFTFPSTSKAILEHGSKFPPLPSVTKSADTSCCCSSQSDSSVPGSATSLDYETRNKKRNRVDNFKKLPPLGLYWDIENVSVPRMKNAAVVVQKLREVFLKNYRESEFVVVCDVKKENAHLIQELDDSQVSLIHVSSTSKNAADEKLRQYLRRFAELHPAPSGVVLISGDVNFASDLSDLRYRKKIRVILVHNVNVADALILCANEHHSFSELTENLPQSTDKKGREIFNYYYLTVRNIPKNIDFNRIRARLQNLAANCGGKCIKFAQKDGIAYLRFGSFDYALRAHKRIHGEDVFGQKIKVLPPSIYKERKLKNQGTYRLVDHNSIPSTSQNQRYSDQNSFNYGQSTCSGSRFPQGVSYHQSGPSSTVSAGPSYEHQQVPYFKQPVNRSVPDEQLSSYRRVHQVSGTGSSDYSDCEEKSNFQQSVLGYNEITKKNLHHPVELNITNLDPSIDVNELRRLLMNLVKEHIMIVSLDITVQADGTSVANLKVSNQQEAQYIISQLHGQKLGGRKILILYPDSNEIDPEGLRAMVVSILQEVPDKSMALFKFMELLESRFQCFVSISDVNKLRDVVRISENSGSRIISLTRGLKYSAATNFTQAMVPYCTIHCPMGLQNRGWLELGSAEVPNVMIPLSHFKTKLVGLLNFHEGTMPLLSFQACYEQIYHESLPVSDVGVPLEHLVTCVPDVELKFVGPNKNIKVISRDTKPKEVDEDSVLKSVAPSLAPNISLLCREVVDLLKTTERCQLLLTKFIPAYHRHYGRQCRVADYGFTKLVHLFESIPHVIQIIGDGSRRLITLTHAAQIRRFTSDLLRVLKVQPARQIAASDFPVCFEKCMNRPFSAVDYGLCTLEDLLEAVPDVTVLITKNEQEMLISISKKEQTAAQIVRTKQFANEVVDLLSHTPHYTMLFNKFVPAYHHHFGHQCKVSDYGFTKLIELFEVIPDVAKIDELPNGERTVSLTVELSMKMLGSQVAHIVRSRDRGNGLNINQLESLYFREYGYPLITDVYQCGTIEEVVEKLSDYVQVNHTIFGTFLSLLEADTSPNIVWVRSWILLLQPPHCMDLPTFIARYKQHFNNITMESLKKISNVISVSVMDEIYVSLTAIYVLAAQLYHVICTNGGSVLFDGLERLYREAYHKPLDLAAYNIRGVNEFYNTFDLLFYVKGNKRSRTVVLHKHLIEHLNSMSHSRQRKKLPSVEEDPDTTLFSTPVRYNRNSSPTPDIVVNMPINPNPSLLADTTHLISPARHLVAHSSKWINSPDPSDVPMPNKLLPSDSSSVKISDESGDSGVNVRLDNSPSDDDIEINLPRVKGKSIRLANWF